MTQKSARPSHRKHYLGPHPIIRHYLERMNFRGIIRDCLGSGLERSLDHAEVLGVLIHNVLVSRGPMYRIQEWAAQIEPEALGLSTSQIGHLNDDVKGHHLLRTYGTANFTHLPLLVPGPFPAFQHF